MEPALARGRRETAHHVPQRPSWRDDRTERLAMFDIPLSDAHAHLNRDGTLEELVQRRERDIFTCFSTTTPAEQAHVSGLIAQATGDDTTDGPFLVSFGIHPWEAAKCDPRACGEAYARCSVIGEIGLDTVWCDVPLARQTTVLEEQLQLAADLGKPIVLHTKGAEERIASMVNGFPGRILVHWYSGPLSAFERFAEQGCYFSLGPDCTNGSDVNRAMMTALPLKRILIETDGIEGITWAIDGNPRLAERIARFYDPGSSLIEAVLTTSIHALADARNVSPQNVATQLQHNMKKLYLNGRIERMTATIAAL